MSFRQEWVGLSCTNCAGTYGEAAAQQDAVPADQMEEGYLGGYPLPPAGVQGRTPSEVYQAAQVWGNSAILSGASGVCPRCSAPVESSIRVCEDHDATEGLCDQCDYRHAVQLTTDCTNCINTQQGAFVLRLAANTDLLAFLTTHGLDPFSPTPAFARVMVDYEEDLISTDPFRAKFTFHIDDDAITLTVNDDLNVTEVTRHEISEPT